MAAIVIKNSNGNSCVVITTMMPFLMQNRDRNQSGLMKTCVAHQLKRQFMLIATINE